MSLRISIGCITPSATVPVSITAALTGPPTTAKLISVQALPQNTSGDMIYVGGPALNKTSGADVYAVLPPGAVWQIQNHSDKNTEQPATVFITSDSGAAKATGFLLQG